MMPLFLFIFEILQSIQYIHPSPFAVVPLHLLILIADQLTGKNLPGVPSRVSNSGLPHSKPTHYQLSYAAPFWNKKKILCGMFSNYSLNPLLTYSFPHYCKLWNKIFFYTESEKQKN
jgi:hypothetical protein